MLVASPLATFNQTRPRRTNREGVGQSLEGPTLPDPHPPHSGIFFVSTENFDLFGHLVRAGHGQRGRPPFEATERDRNKIKLLLALGWSISRIANGVGISPATVKRYFRAELRARDAMRDRLDARRFEIAMEQANAGNVTALKELGKMIERSDLMKIETEMGSKPDSERLASVEKIGKKVIDKQRAIDADADLMAELEREASGNARH